MWHALKIANKVNEKLQEKSFYCLVNYEERSFEEKEDLEQDHFITCDTNVNPNVMWKAISNLKRKLNSLAGTQNTPITDTFAKRKASNNVSQSSQYQKEIPQGPSCRKQKKCSSVLGEASYDSEQEVPEMLDNVKHNGDDMI